ncbi:VOC family protein [Parapedomonas caeni]
MALHRFDHVNIATPAVDATADWYVEALGLRVGPRPAVGVHGHWLYLGDTPVIHLMATDDPRHAGPTGPIDHVAFIAHDVEAMRSWLTSLGIPHRHNRIGDFQQLFLTDPNGVVIELNFPG